MGIEDAPVGSSPRVRGAALRGVDIRPCVGIIPARAGSRSTANTNGCGRRDHPRACGEQNQVDVLRVMGLGSSPRVRGAGELAAELNIYVGIIPARAGSSSSFAREYAAARDHPRACGEQAARVLLPINNKGSSPRVRGAALLGV